MLGAIYAAGVVVALWGSGLELGMREPVRALITPLRNVPLLARVAAVDVVAVPLVVWGLVHALAVPDGYATGLLLVGVAAAGPLGLKATQIARGDARTALSLVIVLELVNLAAIPLWASVLLPTGTSLDVRPVIVTLVVLLLLPLVAGGLVRRVSPRLARPALRVLPQVASAGLVVAIAATLLRDGDAVWSAVGERVPLVALLAVATALWLGWLAGGPARSTRTASALVTGVRANAVALAVASASFSSAPDVRAGVVVFALFSATIPLVLAFVLGRRPAEQLSAA